MNPRQTEAKNPPPAPVVQDSATPPPGQVSIDPHAVIRKLTEQISSQAVQIAMCQVVIDDQAQELTDLRGILSALPGPRAAEPESAPPASH